MAAAMNTQDPFRLDGRIVFLFGPGGYLGRKVAWPTLASSIRVDSKPPVQFLASCASNLVMGSGVDGGRRMDGLVG
jgi:hypothetical protein